MRLEHEVITVECTGRLAKNRTVTCLRFEEYRAIFYIMPLYTFRLFFRKARGYICKIGATKGRNMYLLITSGSIKSVRMQSFNNVELQREDYKLQDISTPFIIPRQSLWNCENVFSDTKNFTS